MAKMKDEVEKLIPASRVRQEPPWCLFLPVREPWLGAYRLTGETSTRVPLSRR